VSGEPSARVYEFGAAENVRIGQAASWTRAAGIVDIVFAVLGLVGGILSMKSSGAQAIGMLVGAAIYLAVGMSLLSAAGSFSAVVETEGNDMPNMLTALSKLKTAFKIQVILVLVAVVLGLLAFFLLFARAR
jgi:hypothetical protein